MNNNEKDFGRRIIDFHQTLDTLRSESGCAWDRSRTLSDMASYLIDEAYELQAEILDDNRDGIQEEIGDTLYVLIYIHYLFNKMRDVSLADIISDAHEKIRRRHPHVFEDAVADNVKESISEWEKVKNKDKQRISLMESVPSSLHPMRRAISVSRRAVNIGFDWPDQDGILNQIEEEIEELREASQTGNPEEILDETGDLLFTMVNLALHHGIDPEGALNSTVNKFIRRFRNMESLAGRQGAKLEELGADQLEELWKESKKSTG
ncbi:MAG: nucleoside triphosphate pyrophosphohydrolase [Candidatus Krumholzibacteriales bacterium]